MSSLTNGVLPEGASPSVLETWVRSVLSKYPIPTADELMELWADRAPLVSLFLHSHELLRNMARFAEGVTLIGVAEAEAFTLDDLEENNLKAVLTTVYVLKTLVAYTAQLSGSDDDVGMAAAPSATALPGSATARVIKQHKTLSSSLRNSAFLATPVRESGDMTASDELDLSKSSGGGEGGAGGSGGGFGGSGGGIDESGGSAGTVGGRAGAAAAAAAAAAASSGSVYRKPMTLEERRRARDAQEEELVEEGFMTKRGGSRRKWQKRFFVLTTKKLTYAANRNKPLKGTIDANDMIAVHDEHDPAEIKKRKNCFCLVTSHRRYYMSCSSEAYKEVWMNSLRSVINFTPTSASGVLDGGDGGEASGGGRGAARSLTESGRASGATINILPETQLRAGFLTKKGGGSSNWAKRWFVLTNWKLTYAAKPDKPVKGTIQVANIKSVGMANPDTCSKSHALEIVTPTRTFEAFAGSEMERNEWIEDIQSTVLARSQHALLSSSRMLLRVVVNYACQPMAALLSVALDTPMTSIKHAIFACLGLDSSLLIHYTLLDDHLVPIEHSAYNLAATSLFDGKTLYLRPKPDVSIKFAPAHTGPVPGAPTPGAGSLSVLGGEMSPSGVHSKRTSRSSSMSLERAAVLSALSVGLHNQGTGMGLPYTAPEVRLSPLAVAETCRAGRLSTCSYSAIASVDEYWSALRGAAGNESGADGDEAASSETQPVVVGGAFDDLTWTAELRVEAKVRSVPGVGSLAPAHTIVTQGYLTKRAGTGPISSRGKGWQRRWFVLTHKCLLYSKAPDGAVKGVIDLDRIASVVSYVAAPAEVAEHCFAIVCPARTYYVACTTEEDMTQWVAALNAMLSGDDAAAAAANPEVLLEGPLRKRGEGEGSSLNSRWCTLTESQLSYATRKGNPARGKISVSHIMAVDLADGDDDLGFNIVTPERTYYFFASNALDHGKWVSTLRASVTVPEFPADPFSCWLIWRRAYEASDLATFCAYKETEGTSYIGGYPFTVARERGVPSLADLITPPVSQYVSSDVLATLTFNDKRTKIGDEYLSGKVHLRRREGATGWLVASEDWSHVLSFLRQMA
ncbi:uncharacterized protein AMSG_08030 [Thecamonas trahens ATCC 50062]|uniref:PH domain-containing protein n=1 Tax=Thecamonas trahens ATCC 50062 TaxID=461836 RepID=A0A0L0DM56_THETB|nr:hypothetical protein AMSG_08030 [Thecamonas trahens ATCC 50062]KNC52473.1 hypothetical protein AMSG_08030 [Thecamonas trahens ATCC 50062]|eukprot:XP_013755273.1 hypothetical protein AMSG_08030 [Thecamonas trahens ATCC 50062]